MQPGDVIADRYRAVCLLGSGGMGAVWEATHLVTGKPVALKVLRPHEGDPHAGQRVLREARAACAVRHPSVVGVHDVIEAADGSPVLVMDLLEGESLRARLDRERTLPLDEALRVTETVLDALDVAHAAGIVHRDLKPDNLFILRDGRVMLLDFGVAKLMHKDGAAAGPGTLTATGAMVGTPFYMAPEQAFGDPIDARADLWAVGVVLYECLAGAPPTHGDNLGQVLRILSTGNIAPLRERAPEVPEAVASVVDALLALDRDARPESARATLHALRAAAGEGASMATRAAITDRPKAAARSVAPPASAVTARAGISRSRKIGIAAAIGLSTGVIAAALTARRAPGPAPIAATTAPVSAAPRSAGSIAPMDPPAIAASPPTAVISARPAPSTRPASSARAKPAPSASVTASASGAPRLLTDVPF